MFSPAVSCLLSSSQRLAWSRIASGVSSTSLPIPRWICATTMGTPCSEAPTKLSTSPPFLSPSVSPRFQCRVKRTLDDSGAATAPGLKRARVLRPDGSLVYAQASVVPETAWSRRCGCTTGRLPHLVACPMRLQLHRLIPLSPCALRTTLSGFS